MLALEIINSYFAVQNPIWPPVFFVAMANNIVPRDERQNNPKTNQLPSPNVQIVDDVANARKSIFQCGQMARVKLKCRLATLDIPVPIRESQATLVPVSTWTGESKTGGTLGAVRRCTRILWPGKASEKTPRGVIPPVCVKYRRMPTD